MLVRFERFLTVSLPLNSISELSIFTAPGSSRALQKLHVTELNSMKPNNFIKMLEDLAKEKKFDVRYLDIKEKSYSGVYYNKTSLV